MKYSANNMEILQNRLIKKIKNGIKKRNGFLRKEYGTNFRASDKSFICGIHFDDRGQLALNQYEESFALRWYTNGFLSITTNRGYDAPTVDIKTLSFVDLAKIVEKLK